MKITTKYILFENEMPEYGTVCKKGKTIRELEEKLKKKDNEIEYLRSALNDILEENKEFLEDEEDDLLDELEDKEYVELEEENAKLKKEKENLEDECFELEEENNKLIAELKEVKSENIKLKMEKIAKKMQESDIKLGEDLAKYIANAGLISLKSCLNAMLLSNKGEK